MVPSETYTPWAKANHFCELAGWRGYSEDLLPSRTLNSHNDNHGHTPLQRMKYDKIETRECMPTSSTTATTSTTTTCHPEEATSTPGPTETPGPTLGPGETTTTEAPADLPIGEAPPATTELILHVTHPGGYVET
jgi:hypothetical protein